MARIYTKLLTSLLSVLFISAFLSSSAQSFEDVANVISLDTVCFNTTQGGLGISFADFNQDGLDDLSLCTGSGLPPLFYENKGNKFELVNPSFVTTTYLHKHINWVDFDDDGDKDLFITANDGPDFLYENDGNLSFSVANAAVGLPEDTTITYGATFADMDFDGDLDLFVSNYDHLDSNRVYYYDSGTGTYTSVGSSTGIDVEGSATYVTTFFDYDLDHDLDFCVINDKVNFANRFFENDGDGTFTNISASSGTDVSIDAMNAGVSDFNHDGYFDFYVTNTGESAMFQNQMGTGTFADVAIASGTIFNRVGWCGNFFDFDNDADEDLYVCNVNSDPNLPNALFVNQNDGTFSEPLFGSFGLGGKDTLASNVNAIGDVNNDGHLDIAVIPKGNNAVRLWINQNFNDNNFVKLKLNGTMSNREAIGARFEVYFDGKKRVFHKHNAEGFLSQNSGYQHVGIGSADKIDSVVVYWPFTNSMDVFIGDAAYTNKMLILTESDPNPIAVALNVCVENHDIHYEVIPPGSYYGENYISAFGMTLTGNNYLFQSKGYIDLLENFEVPLGTDFQIKNGNCP